MTSSRRGRSRPVLASCSTAHAAHDGLCDALLVLLPLWAQAFGLSLTQIGALKSGFYAAMTVGQIPAGLISERLGERRLLALGTLGVAVGWLLLAEADGFRALLLALLVAGVGSSVQHPLASSLVSRVYRGSRVRSALGIYNFAGDVGKALVPALLAIGIGIVGWRMSSQACGIAMAVVALGAHLSLQRFLPDDSLPAPRNEAPPAGGTPEHPRRRRLLSSPLPEGNETAAHSETSSLRDDRAADAKVAAVGGTVVRRNASQRRLGSGEAPPAPPAAAPSGWGITDRRNFALLSVVAIIDASSRSGFLLLAPFLMVEKGLPVEYVGFAIMVIFAGGAAGKFACGFIAERLGTIRTIVITEMATALGIVAAIVAPMGALWVLLAPIGLFLNGTSSALYAAAGELAHEERQARAFGLFYTVTTAASAVAPLAAGLLSDAVDLAVSAAVVAVWTAVAAPIALGLRSRRRGQPGAVE